MATKSGTAHVRRIHNLVPSKDTHRDWRYEHAVDAGAVPAARAVPRSVDLRAAWWAVGDQEQTGACVGWACADGVVRYHMVRARRLGRKELLSPRFVWMAAKETDGETKRPGSFIEEAGTSLKAGMDVCRKFGVVKSSLLAFDIDTLMYTGPEKSFYAAAAQRRIAAYFNLDKDLRAWKSWLASHGPILAGLNVDDAWDNATHTRGNLDEFDRASVRGGHAITVVGYTAGGRYIIRNSYGTDWGDAGFGYASAKYIQAGFFEEAYGVTV